MSDTGRADRTTEVVRLQAEVTRMQDDIRGLQQRIAALEEHGAAQAGRPNAAPERAAPVADGFIDDLQTLNGAMHGMLRTGIVGDLKQLAEHADGEVQAQRAKLDGIVDEVRALMERGEYDRAEMLLVDVRWAPESEAGTKTNEKLAAQYDEKRATLQQILGRKREPAPGR